MRYLLDEELELGTRFLFLSMAMVVIKQDIDHVQKGAFKIKEPYMKLLNKMETEASIERRELRVAMRQKKIQVITLNRNDSFSTFLFICENREEKRNYFNPAIRKKVEAILDELMAKALRQHQLDIAE